MGTYYFTGGCKWAKVFKADDKYGKYGIDVALDEVQQKEYDGLKMKGKPRDGYVSFSSYPDKNKGTPAQKPLVVDAEGKPFEEMIGNGSNVTIKIETYPYDNKFGKGNGHRLLGVKVNKHVKYEKDAEVASPNLGGSAAASAPSRPDGRSQDARPKILF